jgi:uncharacterized repeat protein (TIGR03803 family)
MKSKYRVFSRHSAFAGALLALSFVAAGAAQAQTYTVLYQFPGGFGPSNPSAREIVQGRDGNLYSTNAQGDTDDGAVFKITPSGTLTTLSDVSYFPAGGVTLGTDGNYYGTDQDGGPGGNCGFAGCGQVYKVSPAGVETVLYNFTGFADGADPQAAPIEGADGNYYGTTVDANGGAYGTVYKITPGGVLTTLYTFNVTDGNAPTAPLLLGTDGNFYGTASQGGTGSLGVIFRMTPAGAITVLHNFTGAPDGATPNYGLIQATDGNFYGVTTAGGSFYGTVFKITPSGTYTVLYTFTDTTDGNAPNSALAQATNGKLYGVASGGGTSNDGTIYTITTTGTFTTLHNFDGTDGLDPASPLKQNTNGILYSDTYNGGTANDGVFYSLNLGLGPFVSLVTTSGREAATVGILGQGFSHSSVVKFDGIQGTAVNVSGSAFISATVPAGALTGLVTVTTGATTLTSNQKFRVTPVLTSFTPPSGPVGTPVVITGSGLTQATKVTFGGVIATTFTVNSDTQVTADVPTGAVTGRIVITTPGGTATSTTGFTVN